MIAPADMRRAMRHGESPRFFDRPIVILSAPRSGSTLLYELLARSPELWSIGGESHAIIEDLAGLDPTDGRVRSNRLTAEHADPSTAAIIRAGFIANAFDAQGTRLLQRPDAALPKSIRFLEKTPKNALRVPFLRTIWPDALFVFLIREPHASVSSMLEAWESGKFVTYADSPVGPWSMLLPEGYENAGTTIEERAAFQWREANRVALADLRGLSGWCVVAYDDLVADPDTVLQRIGRLTGITVKADTLPLSTHTLSPPAKDKWRRNADRISGHVAPLLPLYRELQLLTDEVR